MRILIINTSEKTGGAAVASNRLLSALNNNGVKAKMLVRNKETENLFGCEFASLPKTKVELFVGKVLHFSSSPLIKKGLIRY